MKTPVLFFLFLLAGTGTMAQSDSSGRDKNNWYERRLALVAAYNGWGFQYAELGIAFCERGVSDRHSYGTHFSASCELRLDRQGTWAPKLAWVFTGNGGAFGLNLLYYTGPGQEGALRFRPETGIGMSVFKLVYGYNVPLTNKHFMGINRHNLNLTVVVGVKKLKTPTRH